jgi:DNA-directed RNA polymerase specialized sigma24 family protein
LRLNPVERDLVGRIALQEYTLTEAAELTGMSVRTVVRRYTEALDRLTQVFLRLKLLQVPGAR